jgi:hypothetical protein
MVSIRISQNESENDLWYDTLFAKNESFNGKNGDSSEKGDGAPNGDGSGNGDSGNGSFANNAEITQATAQVQNFELQSENRHEYLDEYKLLHYNLRSVHSRLINNRWMDLYDVNNFQSLQVAIINEHTKNSTKQNSHNQEPNT